MSCTSPNFLIPTGFLKQRKIDGKSFLEVKFSELSQLPVVFDEKDHCFKMLTKHSRCFIDLDNLNENGYIVKVNGKLFVKSLYQIPCGKCLGCLEDRAKDWTCRNLMELKTCDNAIFLTLTYDESHLPINHGFPTLNKTDLSAFLKRLRKHFEPFKLRFFACGEYGTRTFRPHYHLIVYGYPYFENRWAETDELSKIWKNGNVYLGSVTAQSIAYVSRYVVKKQGITSALNKYQQKEFVDMSRRPGIGADWINSHLKDISVNDEVPFLSHGIVHFVKPPRYFDKKLKDIDPNLFQPIADKRVSKALANVNNSIIANGLSHFADPIKKLNELRSTQNQEKLEILKSRSKL
jgi:hypothetical protein